MDYLLAILCPPLGCLIAGRPGTAVLMLLACLTLIGWPIAAIWALMVVSDAKADRRMDRVVRAQQDPFRR